MKVKFYLLPIILFLFHGATAQDCSSLSISCTSSESRCVATGSITVTVTGGSGNYNFKATGPVTTPTTSSNIITGLAPGYYTVQVTDLIANCSKSIDSVYVPGNYGDPRFQLTKTDATCAGNDGTISTMNVQYGRAPFSYTIIAPSPSSVGTTNSSGNFSGLIAGEYSVQLMDSCGGIQVRTITIENYSWWFDTVSVTRVGCDSADAFIRIKDNKGNINTSGTAFDGFSYGVVISPGDTTWFSAYSFRLFIGTRRNLTIVVKDDCDNVHSTVWHLPNSVKPSLSSASLNSLTCTNFTASVTGQNLTDPQYCIYNSANVIIACNTTGVFNNLPYGDYCIQVTDMCYDTVISRCFTAATALPSVASSVSITNKDCATFTATITGQQNLSGANYCLYDASDVVVACNSTGVFNNVPYGTYCIEIENACADTVISRCFTVVKPTPTLTGYAITGSNCSTFNVSGSGSNLNSPVYCLYDNLGNVITCNSTGIFTGISHGSYCIRAISCGDTTNSVCFTSSLPVPFVGAGISIINRQCETFGVSIWGQQNLTNPQYCLYDNNDSLLQCNNTGAFDSIAYGSYCIKIVNTCYDTTITRCFTQLHSQPGINSTLQLLSSNCTSVSFKANGTNLTSPTYCLYDVNDSLLSCNSTGTFNNYPYGTYCVVVEDGCIDTSMRVCRTFAPVRGVSLTTSKSCTIGTANVDVQFENGNAPYSIEVYHPNGSLFYSTTTSTNPLRIQLPALPPGTQYKVVGTDNCANRDSASIIPDANIVTKTISVRAKCPGATWLNGSGDLMANCFSNYHAVIPEIIKKNGVAFVSSYSSVLSNVYTFADLEPAEYIVEYTQTSCNGKIYDTITVPPYAYPSQGQSAIYQCDNNSFSLGADVQGGVSPYTFQIIGSMPSSPDITTMPQNNPLFSINTGTTYSLVRLRTVDACGNATLSDVSVLPLQNISVAASDSCFFRNITLSVDTIPNAVYIWYRKTSPTDSVLLDSSISYNLPFFMPEEVGIYICKVSINDGCITRLSYFTLDGDCGNQTLPVSFQLRGKKAGAANQLSWSNKDEAGVQKYIVERKRGQGNYVPIGSITVQNNSSNYLFNDNNPDAGVNYYRLKVMYVNKVEYTNVVSLKSGSNAIIVYPNPVKDVVNISLNSDRPTSYLIELINTGGQVIHKEEVKNVQSTIVTYKRTPNVQPGIYLLRITDVNASITEIRKLLFE